MLPAAPLPPVVLLNGFELANLFYPPPKALIVPDEVPMLKPPPAVFDPLPCLGAAGLPSEKLLPGAALFPAPPALLNGLLTPVN